MLVPCVERVHDSRNCFCKIFVMCVRGELGGPSTSLSDYGFLFVVTREEKHRALYLRIEIVF